MIKSEPQNRDWMRNSTKNVFIFSSKKVRQYYKVLPYLFDRKTFDLFRLGSHTNRGSGVTLCGCIVSAVIGIIKGYRFVSGLFPPRCRFYPSCSAYSEQAFGKYGFFKGTGLTVIRLFKCHPYHPGGIDYLK